MRNDVFAHHNDIYSGGANSIGWHPNPTGRVLWL